MRLGRAVGKRSMSVKDADTPKNEQQHSAKLFFNSTAIARSFVWLAATKWWHHQVIGAATARHILTS